MSNKKHWTECLPEVGRPIERRGQELVKEYAKLQSLYQQIAAQKDRIFQQEKDAALAVKSDWSSDEIAQARREAFDYKANTIESITRQQFMDFFRADDFHEHVSPDDCIEIFNSVLLGSSDITAELFQSIINDYSAENVQVIDTTKYRHVKSIELNEEAAQEKMELLYLETPSGFHIGLDTTYIEQVGDFILPLPTGEVINTANTELSLEGTKCRNGRPIDECDCC